MPVMDTFHVVEVLRGKLKANVVDVRPLSFGGSSYPNALSEGMTLTLRLTLSDESQAQAEENERKNYPWLIVNAAEVRIETP
jgi:hypothetical protein